ncbi:hypothetical protein AB0F43_36010 [Kribbella sp. NPDC023972]|uniref:DUF6891 domain-containing protein n=1 Tax=Kribbella sp. NPDC023972 TaxID=3154795 RepID=UPI0033D3F423
MGIFEELTRDTDDPDAIEGLRGKIEAWIRPGFYERAEVVDYATDYRDDDELPVTDEQLEQLVGELWQARLAEQESWPERTDADRLAAAFDELDTAGVIARMNFTCCQTCGTAEIADERPADRLSSGYVFFHQQDAETLVDDPAHLFLAYGPFEPERDRFADQVVEVGRQVVAVLESHSLPVTWNGTAGARIQIGPITWLRRLPA